MFCLQLLKKSMIFNRIEFINHKIDTYAQFRLNKRKSFMNYEIDGLCKEILDEWIFKYDQQTHNGQKLEIQFGTNSWTTGDNTPPWLYWRIVNNGVPKNYVVNNVKHRLQDLNFKNVGPGYRKAKVYSNFNFKNPNGEWVPLGRC